MEEESVRLEDIKQKAIDLKHTLEKIRFDGTQSWKEVLKIYSLAATNLKHLQENLMSKLEHFVVIPDVNVHEDPGHVPRVISSKLLEDLQMQETKNIENFKQECYLTEDLEDIAAKYNDFVHELRSLLRHN